MEGKFNELKSQEGTVPPSQKMRNKPVNVESETRTQKARKLMQKSGFIKHQVDKPEPHLENYDERFQNFVKIFRYPQNLGR